MQRGVVTVDADSVGDLDSDQGRSSHRSRDGLTGEEGPKRFNVYFPGGPLVLQVLRHVVLGQLQQIDGHLRITAHLIRTRDQSHVWAQRFEPSASDTEHLDREVSEAVAGAIAKRLLGG